MADRCRHVCRRWPVSEAVRTDYARCRTFGHSWDITTPKKRPVTGVVLALRCTVCGMLREDTVSRTTGELFTRSYTQPSGYADVESLDRAGWRVTFLDLADRRNGKRR